jgi:hypothetical protein
MGALKILRIVIDGHFHGSADVPKPWVAQIDGVDAKFGLARTFVQRLNDYRGARQAISGNTHGVVAAFPLHDGHLYEVSRIRGRSSKRYVAREFLRVVDGETVPIEPAEALATAEPHPGPVIEYVAADATSIARADRLGTPTACGFVLIGRDRGERMFRLRVGSIHEIRTGEDCYLALAEADRVRKISHPDAIAHVRGLLP